MKIMNSEAYLMISTQPQTKITIWAFVLFIHLASSHAGITLLSFNEDIQSRIAKRLGSYWCKLINTDSNYLHWWCHFLISATLTSHQIDRPIQKRPLCETYPGDSLCIAGYSMHRNYMQSMLLVEISQKCEQIQADKFVIYLYSWSNIEACYIMPVIKIIRLKMLSIHVY